ncbi:carbohydrate-binding protein [Nostoc sp. FACHB-190]|uniref:carbohydrate-binding protein n=1 Tax=Nostoc sp. FACHB-190 TaxID=2692838 RepID=UPI001686F69E|nr:carbohydrate-binding protein [Nostoc sp. FACHB-190]MBD2297279.1 carbohydrate-binding protein [Nostoc sp. FACHB-190]
MIKNKISKFLLYAAIALVFSLSSVVHAQTPINATSSFQVAANTSTIPSSSIAPWPVLQRIDALNFSSNVGLKTIWGDYWERSEEPFSVNFVSVTQELTNAANGNYAVYNNLDLGSGVEALMLRISLPSGTNSVEVRLGSASGSVVGNCSINSTGSTSAYRTVLCPLNKNLAKGTQNLVIRFTGISTSLRFNWFAFWANNTVQKIDEIQKVQDSKFVNQPAPFKPIAGSAVRTKDMLPGSSEILAKSYSLWSPGKTWECPKWMHDTYWTKGEDGKVYPTWHSPVDFNPETNTYCTYGHEHGDDPRGSEVFNIAGMPAFGYVNEQLAANNPSNPSVHRHEDHFGHKVLVANNWRMYDASDASKKTTCDAVIKVHMGSHSADALVNTAHEMFVSGKCDGHEPFNLKQFALFGVPGSFIEPQAHLCTLPVTPAITPNPTNQPNGGFHRAIPTAGCYVRGTQDEQSSWILKRNIEFWLTSFAGRSFYFTVTNPARFYDPSSATKIKRTVDVCYDSNHPLSKTLLCQEVLASGSKVTWDDPRSPFRGTVHLNTHFSGLEFANSSNSVIYTDAYGKNKRTSPEPANGITLKQIVPVQGFRYRVDGNASVFPAGDYSAAGKNGVRAPN